MLGSNPKPALELGLGYNDFVKDVQRQRQQRFHLLGLSTKQQPNHVERTRSLSLQLNWRKPFKMATENALQLLPPGVQGCTPTCSSEGSTITPLQSPGAVQLFSRKASAPDVVDAPVDVRSSYSFSCRDDASTAQTSRPQHDSTALLPGSSSSPGAFCTACCSSNSSPAEQAPVQRQRTTSSILAACATQARKLRQHSTALLKPVLHPKPPPVAHRQDAPKAAWLSIKGPKAISQHTTSLQPLSLNSKPQPQKQRRRAASLFEATGRENIRVLLGPNAVCGSITRYKMLMLAEQVHEQHLQTVLDQPIEEVDWAGEPAWQEDFSVITNRYAQRVRQFLFWWGGALSPLRWRQSEGAECVDSISEEAAAQVAVVVAGENHPQDGVGPATTAAASKPHSAAQMAAGEDRVGPVAEAAAGKPHTAAVLATAQTM